MGIPEGDTAVLTGKTSPERRLLVWQSQRVFFCTPQTVQRDLESERVDATKIVCVVLDEAHKATGDYAYCKVVQALEERGARFRVLGLSGKCAETLVCILAARWKTHFYPPLKQRRGRRSKQFKPSLTRYVSIKWKLEETMMRM